MNALRKPVLLAALLLCCAYCTSGQKVPKSITKRDDRNIRAAASQTIEKLINLLNFVAEPENSPADLDDAIANAVTADSKVRIFYQNDFEADDDLDLEAEEPVTKDIRAYLRQFRNFYMQNKSMSVRYAITEVSDIHIGEANLYLKVYFNQLMNGKDRRGNAFPSKMPKVAEMQVVSIGGQWQTLISHLDRQSRTDRNINAPKVAISDAATGSDDFAGAAHSEAYYQGQLQNGTRLLKESNFTEAYYSLKEAKRYPATEAEADTRIDELMSKMRGQNIEPTEALYNGLSAKAVALQDRYRYELAKNYYSYAKEVKPAAAKAAATAILAISQLQAKERVLFELLDQGSYSEAARGFNAALDKESHHPGLYIGLARAYAGMGRQAEAEEAFAAAIRADATYPETYKWKGYYYKGKKDFRQAYDAFAAYQARAEDDGDKTILSEMAYCQGKMAMAQNNVPQALEAFSAAAGHNPENTDVLIAQADLMRSQGEKGIKAAKKLIEEALRRDSRNPEAYSTQARIFEIEANKAGAAAAYESAIKYDKDNPRWYYELGKLQMELNDKTDNSAILTFTSCINIRTASREEALMQILALWKRGKCYYLQNRIDEAEADYEAYLKQAKMVSMPFNVDYANLLIKKARYDEAFAALKKAGERPEALLSFGILNYTRYPTNESAYADYFTRAFRDGVSEEAVKAAPNMRMIYENCALVKSLVKKFKYNADF